MPAITIGRDGARVALTNHETGITASVRWSVALAVGTAIQRIARGVWAAQGCHVGPAQVRRDGDTVIVADRVGRVLAAMPSEVAVAVGNAVIAAARAAETDEAAVAEAVMMDHALLQRLGINLGLTSNPALQAWAGNEAAWNSLLRRWVPSSERLRQYHVGVPGVYGTARKRRHGQPRSGGAGGDGAGGAGDCFGNRRFVAGAGGAGSRGGGAVAGTAARARGL